MDQVAAAAHQVVAAAHHVVVAAHHVAVVAHHVVVADESAVIEETPVPENVQIQQYAHDDVEGVDFQEGVVGLVLIWEDRMRWQLLYFM